MRREISNKLDSVDALEPGAGKIDAFVFGEGNLKQGKLGLGVEIAKRLNADLSMFAGANAGYYYGDTSGLGYDFMAGIRGTF